MKKRITAGLDLGTTKVCAIIAEETETSKNILGLVWLLLRDFRED